MMISLFNKLRQCLLGIKLEVIHNKLSAFIFFGSIAHYGILQFLFQNHLFEEDSIIENYQILLLGLSLLFSFFLFLRTKYTLYNYLLFGILFVLLEEISYGQRIFHLKTPVFLKLINSQHEINLHNIFSLLETLLYTTVGVYVSLRIMTHKTFPLHLFNRFQSAVVLLYVLMMGFEFYILDNNSPFGEIYETVLYFILCITLYAKTMKSPDHLTHSKRETINSKTYQDAKARYENRAKESDDNWREMLD